jgi:hypothetical protein
MPRQFLVAVLVSFSLLSTAANAAPPAAKPPAPKPRPATIPPVKAPTPAAKTNQQVHPPHAPQDQDHAYRHHHYRYIPYGVVWDYPVRVYHVQVGLNPSEHTAMVAPRESGAGQTDTQTGMIAWPTALQGDAFQDARQAMEQLAAERPTSREAQQLRNREIRKLTYAMRTQLKRSAGELTETEYVVARMFLDTLVAKLQTT